MKSRPTRSSRGRMLPNIAALAAVVLVVITVVLLSAACGGGTTATSAATPTSAGVPTSVPADGGTVATPAGSAQVVLQNLSFSPETVTIALGGTVTWTNQDSAPHTVVGDNGEFQSGDLATGGAFSFTFDTAGTHTYHCSIHPSMTGTVIVQ